VLSAAGCSPASYARSADREVYGIVKAKSAKVPGMLHTFTVEQAAQDVLAGLPRVPERPPTPAGQAPAAEAQPVAPGQAAAPEGQAAGAGGQPTAGQMPAADSDPPAAEGQPSGAEAQPPATGQAAGAEGQPPAKGQAPAAQGEAAIGGAATGEAAVTEAAGPEAPVPAAGVEQELEPGAALVSLVKALEIAALNNRDYQSQKESVYLAALSLTFQRYQFNPHFFGTLSGQWDYTGAGDEQEVSAKSGIGFDWLFWTGARLSTSLTTSVSEFLTGDPRKAASSLFSATITQPILQGAGIAVTESLTQAERNVVYQLRDFVRFRQTFFVNVLSSYYRVLQALQVVENQRLNYQDLKVSLDYMEWRSKAGLIPEYQVDQTRQAVLSAENSLVTARQSYRNALDQFKITLALPTETLIALDPKELDRLPTEKLPDISLPPERIEQLAMDNRLDLRVQRDRLEDSERQVKVAENALLPGLGLTASVDSSTVDNKPLKFTSNTTNASVGLELDLPLDRLSERNNYRSSLISLAASKRSYTQARDQVVQDVRDDWRQYMSAMRSYQIQEESVRLANRRVESTKLLLEAGRAEVRDVLDALSSLVNARNSLARAVVDYRVARLQLSQDIGILRVDENGQLGESFDEYK